MPVSNDLQSLRVKLGYVNSGNNNLTMYIINWLLVIATAIVVGLVWTLYGKKEGVTEVERKDMLFVGIIASILLFLMVVPINIARSFTSTVSRHPIYFVYFCLASFLITFVGIYHEKVDSTEQKGYVIAILIILGLIILGSALMLWWTSHPYSTLTPIEILGDEDFYAINNKLYTKNVRDINNIKYMTKFLDTSKKELSDPEFKALQTYYNQKASTNKVTLKGKKIANYKDNDKKLLEIQLRNYISDLEREKNNNIKTFYSLARFKEGYDYRLSYGSIEEKKERLQNYINDFEKNNPLDYRKIYPMEPALINQIRKEGILTAEEYNQYLGYYNPIAGASTTGYVSKIQSLEKKYESVTEEKDVSVRQLANQKAIPQFIAQFNDLVKTRAKEVKLSDSEVISINSQIQGELYNKISDYIIELDNTNKRISDAKGLAKNYFQKFTDCKDGATVIDFTNKLPKNGITQQKIINALSDCLKNKKIETN